MLGTVLPAIFLGVAAFLLNVVVSRLVATQREQIAALKAFGYANRAIAAHYLKLVLLIVADRAGARRRSSATGLGTMFTGLYAEFFHFPTLRASHRDPGCWSSAPAITTLAAVARHAERHRRHGARCRRPRRCGRRRPGTLPAHAARAAGHPGACRPALRMIVRNMERRPLRTGARRSPASPPRWRSSSWATSSATRSTVVRRHAASRSACAATSPSGPPSRWTTPCATRLARLPGVTHGRVDPLRAGAPSSTATARERGMVRGYAPRGRALPRDRRRAPPDPARRPRPGADRPARRQARRCAWATRVAVEVLEGRERTLELRVDGTVREMIGPERLHGPSRARPRSSATATCRRARARRRRAARRRGCSTPARRMPRVAGAWS